MWVQDTTTYNKNIAMIYYTLQRIFCGKCKTFLEMNMYEWLDSFYYYGKGNSASLWGSQENLLVWYFMYQDILPMDTVLGLPGVLLSFYENAKCRLPN